MQHIHHLFEHVDIRHLFIFVVMLYPILTAVTVRWVLDKRYVRQPKEDKAESKP